jgi:hypothetical protein
MNNLAREKSAVGMAIALQHGEGQGQTVLLA